MRGGGLRPGRYRNPPYLSQSIINTFFGFLNFATVVFNAITFPCESLGFGVTAISDPSQVNLSYKYTISGVAEELGYSYWGKVLDLIKILKDQTGFDMKASDNQYHITMRTGKAEKSVTHKYSEAAVDLLRKVLNGDSYGLIGDGKK